MDTTEIPTPQPGCEGDPLASITQRWSDLLGCTKSMCAVMRAFNSSIDIGYAPMGLGEQVWAELTTLSNLVDAARISITPAIVASGRWKTEGSKTPEEWMANRTGSSTGNARSQLETGKNLRKAPGTQESFLNGEISAEQANTIADAVETNPAAEDDLLDQAKRDSLKNLKDEAARRKAEVEDIEERERRVHRKRYVRQWTDQEGAWNLRARGPLPTGSDFMAVLEGLIDQQFKKARKAGVRGTRDNYAYDALMNLANQHSWETGPGDGHAGGSGGGNGLGGDGGTGGGNSPSCGSYPSHGSDGGGGYPSGGTSPGSDGSPRGSNSTGSGNNSGGGRPSGSSPNGGRVPDSSTHARPANRPWHSGRSGAGNDAQGCGQGSDQRIDATGPIQGQLIDLDLQGDQPCRPSEVQADPAAAPKQPRRSTPPAGTQRIFCIDWTALARGRFHPGERCELRGLGAVSVATVRQALLAGTARMVVIDSADRVVTVALIGTGAINGRILPMGNTVDRIRAGQLIDLDGMTNAGAEQEWPGPISPSASTGSIAANSQASPCSVIIGVRVSDLLGSTTTRGLSGTSELPQTVDVPGVGPVDRTRLTDLLGQAIAKRIMARGQAVRSISHTGRAPSTAQRIALQWADTTCKVPRCHNQRVEIDHRHPWAANRVTELDNLDPLCGYHHDLKTHDGWAFTLDASPRFVAPGEPGHPGNPGRGTAQSARLAQ